VALVIHPRPGSQLITDLAQEAFGFLEPRPSDPFDEFYHSLRTSSLASRPRSHQ